jgi:hypothetical protein
LSKLTGKLPTNAQAHHIFPQAEKFADFFQGKCIDIHDPKYGSWWNTSIHQQNSSGYNKKWTKWINKHLNATKQDVINQGRVMAKEYNLEINF